MEQIKTAGIHGNPSTTCGGPPPFRQGRQIKTISVAKAVEYLRALGLSVTDPTLRAGFAQGQYPFGTYIRNSETGSGGRGTVFVKLLDEWVAQRCEEPVKYEDWANRREMDDD